MKQFAIRLIKIYQATFALAIGGNCRFLPSCSQYAAEAVEKNGLRNGIWQAVKRFLRCHPFCVGGYDPVA